MIQKSLLSRWQSLPLRSRTFFSAALIIILLMFFWLVILSPLLDYKNAQKRALSLAENDLRWMRNQKDLLVNLRVRQALKDWHSDNVLKNQSLFEMVSENATQHAIVFEKISENEETLTLKLKQIAFSKLLDWLQDMDQQYGIQVQHLTLQQEVADNGEVNNVDLVFIRR